MNSSITILGSSFDVSNIDFETMCLFSDVIKHKKIFYCGSSRGFLQNFIHLLYQDNVIIGYVSAEYIYDITSELHEVKLFASKYERLNALIDVSDKIIIFPGGFGTVVELFEILDRFQYASQCVAKTVDVILVNLFDYWEQILLQIEKMKEMSLIKNCNIKVIKTAEELGSILCLDTN